VHLCTRHTQIHKEYQDLFERQIEGFITSQGCEVSRFYKIVAQDESTEFQSGTVLAGVINAAMDFKSFFRMMCDAKEGFGPLHMPPLQDCATGEFYFQ
jgi:hypothetical protein